jgi:integrase
MTSDKQAKRREGVKYIPWSRYDDLVAELRKMIDGGDWCEQRDALAMVLGLHGLRVSEVSRLLVSDLRSADEVLNVDTIKRGRHRLIELGVGVCSAIRRWRDGSRVRWLLFTSSGARVQPSHWQRFARAITGKVQEFDGLVGESPSDCFHSLRHTYAMRLLHATGNATLVMGRLGHRKLTSTQEYIGSYGQLGDRQLARIGKSIEVVPSLDVEPAERLKLFAG